MPFPESPGRPHGRALLVAGAGGGIGHAILKRATPEAYRLLAIERARRMLG